MSMPSGAYHEQIESVSPKPLTGRMVLVMLLAFFGVVIGVNRLMMKLAIQTLPGTEVDSAYSASLAYEKEIAAARDQDARDWKVDAHVERSPKGGATLRVEARDATAVPMSGPELLRAASSGRPTSAPISRSTLAEIGDRHLSRQATGVSRRASGIWCSKAISAGQRVFLSKNRVVLN